MTIKGGGIYTGHIFPSKLVGMKSIWEDFHLKGEGAKKHTADVENKCFILVTEINIKMNFKSLYSFK